jgi:N-acetylmuramoyl-L-alanine amidase
VDPARRRELTRFGAPAAFLLAATIAVLLVKGALDSSRSQPTTVVATTTTPPPQRTPSTKLVLTTPLPATTATAAGAQYYEIQTGDTLDAIASKYDTTVDQLLALNPGLEPEALHPGDRIRVG